jgi:hypothetical protein
MLHDMITASIPRLSQMTDLGQTFIREKIADGTFQAVRVGKKRILVVVQSYLDYIDKQKAEGVPEYNATKKAIATRQAIAAKRQAERAEAERRPTLEEVGL